MKQPQNPKLQFLHPESSLSRAKLEQLRRISTELLKSSLLPGRRDSLKVRHDGTILDGHHRIYVLLAGRRHRSASAGDNGKGA